MPWAIGVLEGPRLDRLRPTAAPVFERPAGGSLELTFVADPFVLRLRRDHWMFYEAVERGGKGAIAVAHSRDGLHWSDHGLVFAPPRHLSYPCVVHWRGRVLMTHEDLQAGVVSIFEARELPYSWERVGGIEGAFADPTLFEWGGLLWLFGCGRPYDHDQLRLWWAYGPEGPWHEHPASPVIEGDRARGRPAGRVIALGNRLFRPSQDCRDSYGRAVLGNVIVALDPSVYRELPAGEIAAAGPESWRSARMHHIDAWQLADGSWRAIADGSDV